MHVVNYLLQPWDSQPYRGCSVENERDVIPTCASGVHASGHRFQRPLFWPAACIDVLVFVEMLLQSRMLSHLLGLHFENCKIGECYL